MLFSFPSFAFVCFLSSGSSLVPETTFYTLVAVAVRRRKIYVRKRSAIFVSFILEWILFFSIFTKLDARLSHIYRAYMYMYICPCVYIFRMSNTIYSLQRMCLIILNKNGTNEKRARARASMLHSHSFGRSVVHRMSFIPIVIALWMCVISVFCCLSKIHSTKIPLSSMRERERENREHSME